MNQPHCIRDRSSDRDGVVLIPSAIVSENKAMTASDIGYCSWSGKSSDLSEHLQECPYQVIRCQYCSDLVFRKCISIHHTECNRYPVQCSHCSERVSRCLLSSTMKCDRCEISECQQPRNEHSVEENRWRMKEENAFEFKTVDERAVIDSVGSNQINTVWSWLERGPQSHSVLNVTRFDDKCKDIVVRLNELCISESE